MYKNETISINATLNTFMVQFINSLLECVSENFVFSSGTETVENSGDYTSAEFQIFGGFKIAVSGVLLSGSTYVKIDLTKDGTTIIKSQQVVISNNNTTGVAVRTARIKFAENDSAIVLRFYDKNLSGVSADLIFVKTTDKKIAAFKNGIATGETFFDFSDGLQKYTMVSRLPYDNNNSTKLEIITNKVFLQGTQKNFVSTGLIDCTNTTADTLISMDSKNYYTVDTNTLMEVVVNENS